MENLRMYMIFAAYLLIIGILISIPFRRKVMVRKAGTKLMDIKKYSLIFGIVVYLLSLGIVSVLWIREFGVIMDFILCGCGVLGAEIVTRDVCLYKKYGVYEKGILFGGQFIAFDDIVDLPLLKLSPDERKLYDESTIVFTTKSKGKKSMTFKSEEEKESVLQKVLELNPELK